MKYGWSLCARQWEELKAALAHLTWSRVFVAKRWASDVPCEAGVYMLCTPPPQCPLSFKEGAGLFNALYVGRADDLRRRFNNYCRRKNISEEARRALDELLGEGGRMFFIFSVIPPERLRETEGCLIRCLGPSVNKRDEIKLRGKVGLPIPA